MTASISNLIDKKIDDKLEILDRANYEQDPTCLTVIFKNEDHTLGNSLKNIISRYSEVEFCGYNVPHPLEDRILFRIQTKNECNSGEILQRGLRDLERIFANIREKFQQSFTEFEDGKIDVS